MRPACVIEALEVRSLLSVAAGLPADAAAEAPSVRLITRSLVTTGTSHTFHLVVSSSAGLSPTTVGDDDVSVSGPRGFAAAASVVGVAASTDGTRQIVTCRVAAPGGRFDRSDNGVYRIALRDGGVADDAGAAAPGGVIGGFRVFARRLPSVAAVPTLPIPASTSAGALTATITNVYAWCDHMPGFWPEPDNREYLLVTTVLRNTSDQPIEVRLNQAFISFDENELGTATDGLSVKSPSGPPSGVKTVILQPGESRTVVFRGNGVYPEGRHGQRLYVTLQFTAGDATLAVRGSAVVAVTY
jgi:hypothetical protein